ncbi:hypothetical protein ASZ78_002514, partial [Callipepla squamata]
ICSSFYNILYLSRLEASVIVRDMCLADNAISARKDSTIYNSQTLMAAVLVTVIPLGQSMEILPVTKIQASASAKQMLLVLDVIVAILDLKLSDILMKMDDGHVNTAKNIILHLTLSREVPWFAFVYRCQHCNCHPAGAISGTCHLVTGQCVCKQFVTGLKCDNCVPDASNLDVHNIFGCSKTPLQQPPPTGEVLNSTAISLTWNSPDSPNSNRLIYLLYRDEAEIYTAEDYYPYSIHTFIDTTLSPYTFYSYYVQTSNIHGFTRSASVTYRTKSGTPTGSLHLNPVFPVSHHSALLYWTTPSNDSGPIEKYILTCTVLVDLQPCGQYEGSETSAIIWNLMPFTKFYCITLISAPVFMPSPSVFPLSPYSLNVSWEKPDDNLSRGEVIGYSISLMTEQRILPTFSQVLHIAEAHELSYIATGLKPYRTYNFTITLCNQIGCVTSEPGMGQTLAAGKEMIYI